MKLRSARPHALWRLWKSKGFGFFLMAIVVLVSISVAREAVRRLGTMNEIRRFEAEVTRLQQRNSEMGDLIAYLGTSTHIEKEARTKLGLQKEAEKVIVFPQDAPRAEIILPNSDKIEYIEIKDAESNPKKWFNYFKDRLKN